MKYDLLLRNARIVDPQNRVDAVTDLGIGGGKVVEVGESLPTADAAEMVDLEGLTAIPGVIDTHVHIRGPAHRMMARAGVCTALDMADGAKVLRAVPEVGAGLNIAALQVMPAYPDSAPDREEGLRLIRNSLIEGSIGIKLIGGHDPSSPRATQRFIELANEVKSYVAFHVGTTETGSHLGGLLEAIELAGDNCLHVAHVNSYLRGITDDPVEEVLEGLAAMAGKDNLVSESYLASINGTGGKIGNDDLPTSHVTRNCLKMGGYTADRAGLEKAIAEGYGLVQIVEGGYTVLVTGARGVDVWKDNDTDVSMSFPVNRPESTFLCATRKDEAGNFVVDAISTDGGGIPRNVAVESGMALVRYGALTMDEFVAKVSSSGARMLGLCDKGHLGEAADADVTVIDEASGRAVMTIVGGRIVMAYGIVYGSGGTIITTPMGEERVRSIGLPVRLVDPKDFLLYAKRSG
ncbi:MAG: amidohydrolase [Clostridia bacterium]